MTFHLRSLHKKKESKKKKPIKKKTQEVFKDNGWPMDLLIGLAVITSIGVAIYHAFYS
jgi:hypothetical protein